MNKICAVISFFFLVLFAPVLATAQIETVMVQADSLPGLWKIGFPAWAYRDGTDFRFGPLVDFFCRMDGPRNDVHVYCFDIAGTVRDKGDATFDGSLLHLAWGTMMLRVVVDATQKSPGTFAGSYGIKFAGYAVRTPDQPIASKIALSESAPDAGGKSAFLAKLLTGIAEGAPTPALVPSKIVVPPGAGDLHALGPLQSVIYLGRTPTSVEYSALAKDWPGPKDRQPKMRLSNDDAYSIYAVEFSKGERLCGIHQGPDKSVDGLRCV